MVPTSCAERVDGGVVARVWRRMLCLYGGVRNIGVIFFRETA
jgi:hypothetical protein